MTTLTTEFVPTEIDARQWANLHPLYQDLLDRELKCGGCLERLILDRSELDAAAREAQAILYIKMTCHTDDASAKKAYLDFVENVEPEIKKISFELDKKIVNSPHVDQLDKKRYEVFLRNRKADVELFRQENVALQTQDAKLSQEYQELCGAMTVTFRGEEKTLPQMAKFLEETDRSTREEAWQAVAERRHQDCDKIDDILDQLIKLRRQVARNADCENYVEYAFKQMHRFDYTPAACEAFHRGAETVCVPIMRQLNTERSTELNIDPLRPWDLAVDVKGRSPLRPFETTDELVEKSSRIFHKLSKPLGDMFDSLRENKSLDLDSRKGKAPGGYQESLDRQRRPFIFMNAAGLQRDLETMLHEAGHAFHSLLCRDEPLVYYRHSPIEFAEVASMSMELLCLPYLGEFYDGAEADRARRNQLEDIVKVLLWIATIDAFQHWMYTNPDHTCGDRKQFWLQLDQRFGAKLDYSGLEHFREIAWQRQLHIFCYPFYYIEYGIAQLGALQIWRQARQSEQKAIQNYTKALKLGGTRPLPELFQTAQLKFNFGPDTMRELMNEVKGELSKLPA